MDFFPLKYKAPTELPPSASTRMEHSAILTGHGGMDKIEVRRSPLAPGLAEDEVEVEVYFCGVNFTDNYLRLGIIRNDEFPVIMGSECSGIVWRVGSGVKDLKVGQGVLVLKMQGGLFRRAVIVPRRSCFVVPDNVSLKSAVALGLTSLMAHMCLFEIGRLAHNQTVFMHSIGGGVGTSVIQLARTVPNVTVLGTASKCKHKKALAFGVKRIFCPEENYVQKILKDYPDGVDIIINTIGGQEIDKCFKFLKVNGKLINIGSDYSAIYPRSVTWRRRMPTWDSRFVPTTSLISKSQVLAGINIGYWLENNPEKAQSILNYIFKLRALWKMKPIIHCKIDIDHVAMALEQLCKRKNFGKVLLVAQEEPFLLDEPGHRNSVPTETVP